MEGTGGYRRFLENWKIIYNLHQFGSTSTKQRAEFKCQTSVSQHWGKQSDVAVSGGQENLHQSVSGGQPDRKFTGGEGPSGQRGKNPTGITPTRRQWPTSHRWERKVHQWQARYRQWHDQHSEIVSRIWEVKLCPIRIYMKEVAWPMAQRLLSLQIFLKGLQS